MEADYDPWLSEIMVGRGQKHWVQERLHEQLSRVKGYLPQMYTGACSLENKQEALELHVQSPNSRTGITKRQWENLHGWSMWWMDVSSTANTGEK